jgi:ABC-type multidrug transport system fused ATPase/permease subunit
MPNVSKYVIESGMIVGAVLISGIQFALQDARHAIAALSVFLAAGTRIAPAIMRLQQSLIQSKSGMGIAEPTLKLIESLQSIPDSNDVVESLNIDHKGFEPTIKINQASVIYPGKNVYALDRVQFNLSAGKFAAIVGPSGAGKTSLVDALLGVLDLTDGQIEISNVSPSEAVDRWPGAIAYVPQEVVIINSSIRENIALGFAPIESVDKLCWEALEVAQLDDFVKKLPDGLDTQVGEKGARLSGGQRQRLGIARAMFTKPKLLVLDEATSSLDGQTELDLSGAISSLQGAVTVVMIAHRLSTVRDADTLVYLDKGRVVAEGKFDEVRANVPNFDRQAQLMGL